MRKMTSEELSEQLQKNGEAIVKIARKHGIHELNLLKAMDEVSLLPKIDWGHEKKNTLAEFLDRVEEEFRLLPLELVVPCNPDCTTEQHSYHQGTWEAHLTASDFIEKVINKLRIEINND